MMHNKIEIYKSEDKYIINSNAVYATIFSLPIVLIFVLNAHTYFMKTKTKTKTENENKTLFWHTLYISRSENSLNYTFTLNEMGNRTVYLQWKRDSIEILKNARILFILFSLRETQNVYCTVVEKMSLVDRWTSLLLLYLTLKRNKEIYSISSLWFSAHLHWFRILLKDKQLLLCN